MTNQEIGDDIFCLFGCGVIDQNVVPKSSRWDLSELSEDSEEYDG